MEGVVYPHVFTKNLKKIKKNNTNFFENKNIITNFMEIKRL